MISSSLELFLSDLDDARQGKKSKHIVPTSLDSLDNHMFGGFENGQLIILAARPGMGKSALGVQFAKHAASLGKRTLFFSLEMPERELVGRLLASEGAVSYGDIRTAFTAPPGALPETFYLHLSESAGVLSPLPLHIVDRPGLHVEVMRQRAKEIGAQFVVVDYLQLARTQAKYEVREQQVAEVSRQLKEMAKELSCPVIALAQLNREVEKRPNKRPKISDLRESGSIEQDADVIMFLYKEGYYNKLKRDDPTTEIDVPKQRAGQPFTAMVKFEGDYMRFTEEEVW